MPKYEGKLPEYPRSGLKAMSVEREKERAKVSVNNGQYIFICLNQILKGRHKK